MSPINLPEDYVEIGEMKPADVVEHTAQVQRNFEAISRSWPSAAPEPWHFVGAAGQPAFQNSWVNFGSGYAPAAFYQQNGLVKLTGLVSGGLMANAVFTLPAGYRPALPGLGQALLFATSCFNGTSVIFGEIRVDVGGLVVVNVGANGYASLDIPPFRCVP